MTSRDRILILDFGSQVTQLIARRLREAGVYCEVMPFNTPPEQLDAFAPRGIILSGSPASVVDSDSPRAPAWVWQSKLPILGICYGQQLMVQELGGRVVKSQSQEFGRAELQRSGGASPLLEKFWADNPTPSVWMSHGDRVERLPTGFEVLGRSSGAPYAIIADEARRYYGVQFHPEVVHTEGGAALLAAFCREISAVTSQWNMAEFRDEARARIRAEVGEGQVICALSGGVDSSVVAVLLQEAIGDQLQCIFVDHGLLRKGEAEEVVALFREHYQIALRHVDESELFLGRLAGVADPEAKRKIIGETFIEVFEREAEQIQGADFLAQGTLYPDVIESVSLGDAPSVTIKSHHNVGGLPERMNLKLVEPLRMLFKDEVRALGRELGLPERLIGRHPFPGPGLAIRIPGEVTRELCDILRQADAIYLEEIRAAGLYDAIWQAFAVLLPVRSVGVMGDARSYERVCALRAVTSLDGMTADVYPFEAQFLSRVATRIVNEVRGINRVLYDYTSKPPGTIEWE